MFIKQMTHKKAPISIRSIRFDCYPRNLDFDSISISINWEIRFVWDFDLTKCIMDASLKLPGPLKAPPPPIKARSGHRSGDAIRFDLDFD